MGKITENKKKMAVVESDKIKQEKPIPPKVAEDDNATVEGYCVKCKSMKAITSKEKVKLKNGSNALKGKCTTCSTTITRMLGKDKKK